MLEQLDPLNFCVVRIEGFFNDLKISTATGFFYYGLVDMTSTFWLVTNWHVLSGRHTFNPRRTLHSKGSIPNRIRLQLLSTKDAQGRELQSQVFLHEKFIEIYSASGEATWFQHQTKNNVDVAVIHVGQQFSEYRILGVNQAAKHYDMAIGLGNDVFILGYPLGFTHFIETPIWKRGSIASEPHLETDTSKGRIVIDATTRAGMSGSL